MKNERSLSRRNFLKRGSLGLGAGIAGVSLSSFSSGNSAESSQLSQGKICVATIDLKGIWPTATREGRIQLVMERMNNVAGLKPDLVCLPELFDTIWVNEKFSIKDIAEDEKVPGPVTSRIAEYAKKNSCYVVCPIYTKKRW